MGMYDTIFCDYPLPDKEIQDYSFQTKDLDEGMNTYLIDEEGELLLIKRLGEEELDPADVIPFHGTLTMYSSLTERIHEPPVVCQDEWGDEFILVRRTHYDYLVIFTEGVLTRIERKEEPWSHWALEALDGSYLSSLLCDKEEFERLLAIELQKPDNRRIIIPEEEFVYEEPKSIKTIDDIPAPILERIKQLRYDRILEKHEGPWTWESALKYENACVVAFKGGALYPQYTILMPFDAAILPHIQEQRIVCSQGGEDMLTVFFTCPKLAGYDADDEISKQWSGFCAVCREVPLHGEEWQDALPFYVTVMLHETFFLEPEMGDNWAFRQVFRS